jgi:hypothetical protein
MKTSLLFILALFLSKVESDSGVVQKLDQQLNALIVAHNSLEAAEYYADDFILTTSSGKVKTKQDMLNEIGMADLVFEINETENVKVLVLENTAVLTGTLHQKGNFKDKAFDARLLVTDTWVRVGSSWKLLAGHATILK